MQSAIGRKFLKLLPEWVNRRRQNAKILDVGLADIPGIQLVQPPADIEHSYYKYYAFLDLEQLNVKQWKSREIPRLLDCTMKPVYVFGEVFCLLALSLATKML